MTRISAKHALRLLPPTLELYFTNRCNLACGYCSSRALKAGGRKTLSFEEIMRAVELVADYSRRGGTPMTVGFTGGEPLLEFDLLRRVIKSARRRHRALNLHVCTNGTLLDREKAAFLLDNGVELDLSLDGAGAAHDRNRRFGGRGRGSVFEAVMANLGKLPRGAVGRLRAVATFDSGTVPFLTAALIFLDGLGFRSAGFGLDIYEQWTRKDLAVLAAALERFGAYYLRIYKEALRGGRSQPAPFPFENTLGAGQSELVSNEFSLSVDGYFFPTDTVRRGPAPGCTIGDLEGGIDFGKLERTYSRLSAIISRYGYPNGILPAADRYYHAVFNGEAPGPALANGLAVSRVFEEKLGGLMRAKTLLGELQRDKSFGDFPHLPKYSAGKAVSGFGAVPAGRPAGSRNALDYFLYSPAPRGRLVLDVPRLSRGDAKLMLYSLVKASQLGRPLKVLLQR